jgi:RHS repeat-associated protein
VERDHPQTNVNQTFISQTGGTGDAGDKYVGLDRFGRVVDDLWTNTSTSTTTDEFQYGYDLSGNRLYRNNTVNTAFGELYTYDGLNQLATFARGTLNSTDTAITGTASRTQSYATNATGDFTSVTTNGTAQTQTSNAQNEVTGVSGATAPTYDANGNMTGDQNGNQFVYDAWNRLVTVKNSGGTTLETFSYDGLGRRVTQTASGTTTDLYSSAQDQVLEEMVGGAATARYVWSPVYVYALVLRDFATGSPGTLNQRLWVQQDADWNVTALVNGSGVVVERYVYDPYGNVTIYDASYTTVRSSSSYAMNYLFQGMRYDSISGLYEANRRWYSPTLQRWTSIDPTRYSAGDVNLYRFVGNNPGDYTDPTGLDRIDQVESGGLTQVWYVKSRPFSTDRRFVGILITAPGGGQFVRRYVNGQPLYVSLAKVNQTADFFADTPSNWDQWFQQNHQDPPSQSTAWVMANNAAQVTGDPSIQTTFNGIYPANTDRGGGVNQCQQLAAGTYNHTYVYGLPFAVLVTGVIAVGTSYGKMGTVVNPPTNLSIKGINTYAYRQLARRNVTVRILSNTLRKPAVVLDQGGRYLYLSAEGGVVIDSRGWIVTAWTAVDHDAATLSVLRTAGAIP